MFEDPWATLELADDSISRAIAYLADAQNWYRDLRYQNEINQLRGVRVKVSADLRRALNKIKEVGGE